MCALSSLDICWNLEITDVAVQAVSGMPALTSLNLSDSLNITDVAVQAVSGMPALTHLDLYNCNKITDEGLQALSKLPALAYLHLGVHQYSDPQITAAGVQTLRDTTASPTLFIYSDFGYFHSAVY
jgi:hypothetical protein